MSELQTERAEENKTHSSGIDIVAAKLAQQEEKMAVMNQTLVEIKTLLNGLQLTAVTNDSKSNINFISIPFSMILWFM